MKTALLIAVMRATVLASRLVATLFIAKFVGIDAVGEYGLINGALSILPVVAGLGLHYEFNRDLVHYSLDEAVVRIRDRQITILAAALVAVAIGAAVLSFFPEIRLGHTTTFVALAILETLCFDLHMNFNSLRMPEFGNLFLFLRIAAWVPPYVLCAWLWPSLRDIRHVLMFWLAGMIVALVALAIRVRDWPLRRALTTPFDGAWIRRHLRGAVMIYVGDLALVCATYLDRFFVGLQFGLKPAGVFVFFWSLSSGLQLLINTSLVQPALPLLVDAVKKGERALFLATMRRKFVAVTAAMITGSLALYAATALIVAVMGRTELVSYPLLFPLLLATATLKAISDLVNYGLYAQSKDRALALTNIGSVFTMCGFVLAAGHFGGLEAVGVALLSNALLILSLRFLLAGPWSNRISP